MKYIVCYTCGEQQYLSVLKLLSALRMLPILEISRFTPVYCFGCYFFATKPNSHLLGSTSVIIHDITRAEILSHPYHNSDYESAEKFELVNRESRHYGYLW